MAGQKLSLKALHHAGIELWKLTCYSKKQVELWLNGCGVEHRLYYSNSMMLPLHCC